LPVAAWQALSQTGDVTRHSDEMIEKPFVVIGGGLAGLTAANALAGQQRPVRLIEQSRTLGGRAGTVNEQGFLLNFGGHALYRKGALYKTLSQWQVPYQGKPPQLKSRAHLVSGTRRYAFPLNAASLFLTGALTPREKFVTAKALQAITASKPGQGHGMTIAEWLDGNVSSPGARRFLKAMIRLTTYANAPDRLAAEAALAQMQMALRGGVLYLDGGWQTLVDGLAGRARSLGVTVSAQSTAERIEPGRVTLADGRQLEASGIILAVPPDTAERLTGRNLPKLTAARFACFDLALKTLPQGASVFALGLDQPCYSSVHSAAAALAPTGKALVHMGKYLAPGQQATREELEQFADIAVPGWRTQVELARFLPNMIVSHAIAEPSGRPDINALGMRGVALAGDWVGDEGMLADAAAASARKAAAYVSGEVAVAA
jgi:protoporphyrinogen oxidase